MNVYETTAPIGTTNTRANSDDQPDSILFAVHYYTRSTIHAQVDQVDLTSEQQKKTGLFHEKLMVSGEKT